MERTKRKAARFLPDVEDGGIVDGFSFPHAAPQIEAEAVHKHHDSPNSTEDTIEERNAPCGSDSYITNAIRK